MPPELADIVGKSSAKFQLSLLLIRNKAEYHNAQAEKEACEILQYDHVYLSHWGFYAKDSARHQRALLHRLGYGDSHNRARGTEVYNAAPLCLCSKALIQHTRRRL